MSDAQTKSLESRRQNDDQEIWTVSVLYSGDAILDAPAPPLPAGDCVIGRSAVGRRDLHLPEDERLSRRHACFKRRGDQLSVRDLDSHNGTRVNGQKVQKADLSDGDVVRCGNTVLLVRRAPAWPTDADLEGLSGRSPAMRAHRVELAMVGKTDATVVLTGETGCGKGAAARALHAISSRAAKPYVAFNCAAIPETLAESTLFGHIAGAFTGAIGSEDGLLRAAHGGTLFIDEVGDLVASLQPKLLHFLDDGTVTPVGSSSQIKVDARIVAATHVDLDAAVASGAFRADLWARLAAVVLEIPPLRARREDVLPLLVEFAGTAPISPDLAEALVLHDWPWNVRELQRVATELGVRGQDLDRWELDLVAERLKPSAAAPAPAPDTPKTRITPDRAELEALLRTHKGVVAQVARALGRSTKQVYRWMARDGLEVDDFR